MGAPVSGPNWNELALAKLTNVLGATIAERVVRETLTAMQLGSLSSAEDLYRFGRLVSARDGFVGAVGGMLTLTAVMRGAQGTL